MLAENLLRVPHVSCVCELRTTIVAVVVACRNMSLTYATHLADFLHCDGCTFHIFNVFSVEINALITDVLTTRPCCESIDLISTLVTEGTFGASAALLSAVVPHMSFLFSPVSQYLIFSILFITYHPIPYA